MYKVFVEILWYALLAYINAHTLLPPPPPLLRRFNRKAVKSIRRGSIRAILTYVFRNTFRLVKFQLCHRFWRRPPLGQGVRHHKIPWYVVKRFAPSDCCRGTCCHSLAHDDVSQKTLQELPCHPVITAYVISLIPVEVSIVNREWICTKCTTLQINAVYSHQLESQSVLITDFDNLSGGEFLWRWNGRKKS